MIACDRGLLPWRRESVKAAIEYVFDAWFASRGGEGSLEGLAAEEAFTSFLYSNSERFATFGNGADRNRMGVKTLTKDRRIEVWVAHDRALIEMLGGQPERKAPFLEHLRNGLSEEWELIEGSDRPQREAPQKFGLPNRRAWCFQKKLQEPEVEEGVGGGEYATV